MSNLISKLRNSSEEERISILKSLPACLTIVAFVAVIAYGNLLLPSRLPSFYRQHLVELQKAYDAARATDVQQRISLAGRMDIAYKRILQLEGQSDQTNWERSRFQLRHVDWLNQQTDAIRQAGQEIEKKAAEQLQQLNESALQTVELLAGSQSDFALDAGLLRAERILTGSTAGTVDYAAEAESLLSYPRDPTDLRPICTATKLFIEQAWLPTASGSALPDRGNLESANRTLKLVPDLGSQQSSTDPLWAELETLRMELNAQLAPGQVEDLVYLPPPTDETGSNILLFTELNCVRACLRADWISLQDLLSEAFEFSRLSIEEKRTLSARVGRALSRLCLSEYCTTNSEWLATICNAMHLAGRLAPSTSELCGLYWQLSLQRAEKSTELSPALVESVAIGSPKNVSYLVLAISAKLAGKDNHLDYLKLAQRVDPRSIQQLVYIASWSARHHAEFWDGWPEFLQSVTSLSPEDGSLWLGLTICHLREEDLLQAETALAHARELLGDSHSVLSLESQIRGMKPR